MRLSVDLTCSESDVPHLLRAYVANLFRIQAATQRGRAEARTGSATKQLLEAEARWCDEQALRLDAAEEPPSVSEREPIRARPRVDIIAVDGPNGGTREQP